MGGWPPSSLEEDDPNIPQMNVQPASNPFGMQRGPFGEAGAPYSYVRNEYSSQTTVPFPNMTMPQTSIQEGARTNPSSIPPDAQYGQNVDGNADMSQRGGQFGPSNFRGRQRRGTR